MRAQSFRRGLQTVHLWAGLILCIPIVLIGLSGSALLVQRELLALSVPSATATGEKQSIVRIVDAARAAAPENSRVGRIQLANGTGEPVSVQFTANDRRQRSARIYVDPVSLELLVSEAVVQRGRVLGFLINLHAFLMLPANFGLRFVGWMGVAMTLMGLSGIVLWWPKKGHWKRAFLVRPGARGLALHLDLHHAVGIWSLAVFLVMSVSGIYLCFPETVSGAVSSVLPKGIGSGDPPAAYTRFPGPIDADQAVESAHSVLPTARAVALQMPEQAGRPIVVHMETRGFGPSEPPILVTLDPDTGEIGYIDDPREYALGDKLLNLQHVLHFAIGTGAVWKILVFLSGLVPLLFAVTGLSIWWARRRVTRRAPEGAAQPAE